MSGSGVHWLAEVRGNVYAIIQHMVRHYLPYELGASLLGSIHEVAHYNPPMLP
ncbi:hypothetical protein C8Q74DRAFT_507289 [Fomes fomentarius]|nr:hypothetical protein C8Q74DRAFT_507289 [Fomes fomentarius]